MPFPTRNPHVAVVLLVLSTLLPAPSAAFECTPPVSLHPDQRVVLCSPEPAAEELTVTIVPAGLEVNFVVPPRDQTSFVSPVISARDSAWSDLAAGETVDVIQVTGTYMGVLDQRIELAIVQIGATDEASGVLGEDEITVAWSSIFRPRQLPTGDFRANEGGAITMSSTYNGEGLQLRITNPADPTQPDTVNAAGLRVSFAAGDTVDKGWTAVFDTEDGDGYRVLRWLSEPRADYVVVGSYLKVSDAPRSDLDWPVADPFGTQFTFLDRFVINGNTYHYAVEAFDHGFNSRNGAQSNNGPFHSATDSLGNFLLPSTQLPVDFLRPSPGQFQPVQAVPNPYRQAECDPVEFDTTCIVRFIKMPRRGNLFIYTLAGDLVKEFSQSTDASGGDPPGTLRWDTRNGAGKEVASGVYIFKIVDLESGQESFGRLAVIR